MIPFILGAWYGTLHVIVPIFVSVILVIFVQSYLLPYACLYVDFLFICLVYKRVFYTGWTHSGDVELSINIIAEVAAKSLSPSLSLQPLFDFYYRRSWDPLHFSTTRTFVCAINSVTLCSPRLICEDSLYLLVVVYIETDSQTLLFFVSYVKVFVKSMT